MAAQVAEEGMTSLQSWLSKPRATVRIDTTFRWNSWMKLLQSRLGSRQRGSRTRIEVIDRLSLGGKKSLLLISIEGRRLLIGVGEDAAPSIRRFDEVRRIAPSRYISRAQRTSRARRMVG
ncbi:MAG TPA: flagellar biosynthetic protein FliO [Acidobacteriaceae bacterium]|jgi:hypothetical protein